MSIVVLGYECYVEVMIRSRITFTLCLLDCIAALLGYSIVGLNAVNAACIRLGQILVEHRGLMSQSKI